MLLLPLPNFHRAVIENNIAKLQLGIHLKTCDEVLEIDIHIGIGTKALLMMTKH